MSRISKIVIIVSIILYVPGIVSGINEKTFVDKEYQRICTDTETYDPDSICRKIGQQDDMKEGTYWSSSLIDGECQDVGVNLEDFEGNPTRINFVIVLCDLGENYKGCASASTEDNVVEYFKYLPNKRGKNRCIHQGSITI